MNRISKRSRVHFLIPAVMLVLAGCRSDAASPSYEPALKDESYVQSLPAINPDEYLYLFDYDNQSQLDIQESRRWQENGLTWTDLDYASPSGGRVPATLVLPNSKGSFAGVILMHGMASNRKSLFGWADVYAHYGAIVLMIDAPYNRPENASRKWIEGSPISFTGQDRQDQIQLIVDLRRGVDLLSKVPQVDPDRLAYLGISYGGSMGGLLAGVEHRLKAYVLIVGDGGRVTHLSGFDERYSDPQGVFYRLPEEARQAWVDMMWPIEPLHYVRQAAPATLLFQNGTLDASVSPNDALRYQQAGSQPKKILWYRLGHDLSSDPRVVEDQIEFLAEPIGVGILLKSAFGTNNLWMDRSLLAWSILVLGSLGWVVWDSLKGAHTGRAVQLFWILAVLLLGPLGLLIYLPVRMGRAKGSWRLTLVESVGDVMPAVFAYLVILILALLVPAIQSSDMLKILLMLSLPLPIGWLLFQGPFLASVTHQRFFRILPRRFPHTWVVVNLGIGGINLLAVPWVNWFFRSFGVMSLWTLAAMQMITALSTLVAILFLYPYEAWGLRRGFRAWRALVPGEGEVRSPSWRNSWWMVLLSYVVLFGGMVAGVLINNNLYR